MVVVAIKRATKGGDDESRICRPWRYRQADAINIAKSGVELTATDLREQPLKELAQDGSRVVGNPREIAESADIVWDLVRFCILMVLISSPMY